MEKFRFQTNVKCGGCIAAITPSLNQEEGIIKWEVDLASPQRVLTVETEGLVAEEVTALLKKAGYQATRI